MADAWWPSAAPLPQRGSVGFELLRQNIVPWSDVQDSSGPALRRGRAGLGYTEPNAPTSQRTLRSDLDRVAHSSKVVMALVWNAGNLDRQSRLDGVNDFIAGNFHIGLLQESAGTILPNLLQSRAIAVKYLPDGDGGNLAITAGGSGPKSIAPLYDENFDGSVPRPWVEVPSSAMYLHGCCVAWVGPDGAPVQRAGLRSWRVASVHYHNRWAKNPDSVRHVLASVFRLMLRDRVRLLGGDFNQAAKHVPEVLAEVTAGTSITYECFSAPSPEVLAVLFNYPGQATLQAEKRILIFEKQVDDFGLRPTDGDSHYPLILCIKEVDSQTSAASSGSTESRSHWHVQSESRASKKNVKKHQKAVQKRRQHRKIELSVAADEQADEPLLNNDEDPSQ